MGHQSCSGIRSRGYSPRAGSSSIPWPQLLPGGLRTAGFCPISPMSDDITSIDLPYPSGTNAAPNNTVQYIAMRVCDYILVLVGEECPNRHSCSACANKQYRGTESPVQYSALQYTTVCSTVL